MYGTRWCGDCKLAKSVLDSEGVPYQWIDIEAEADAVELVQSLNGGMRRVPTILFPDGRVLVEPSRSELRAAIDV